MDTENITVSAIFNADDAKKEVKELIANIEELQAVLQKNIKSNLISQTDFAKANQELGGLKGNLVQMEQALKNAGTVSDSAFANIPNRISNASAKISTFKTAVVDIKKQTQGLKSVLTALQQAFLGFGLSALFMGMNIQKVFMGIARSTTDAFLKIRESAGPANDAISIMGAGFEFLKYAVGDAIANAIEPFLPMILDIIEGVAEWVSTHEGLTAAIIIGGIALGTFLMIVGQLTIPLATVASIIKTLLTSAGFAGLSAQISEAGAIILSLLPIIAVLIAAIILLWIAWQTNFANIQRFIGKIVETIIAFISVLINNLLEFASGVLDVLTGIFEGDGDKIIKGLTKILRAVLKTLIQAGALIIKLFVEVFFFIARVFNDGALGLVKILFDILPKGFSFVAQLIFNILGALAKNVLNILLAPIKGVLLFIEAAANSLGLGWIAEDARTMLSGIDSAVNGIGNAVAEAGKTLGNLAVSGGEQISTFLGDLKEKSAETLDSWRDMILEATHLDDPAFAFKKIADAIDNLLPLQEEMNKNAKETTDIFSGLLNITKPEAVVTPALPDLNQILGSFGLSGIPEVNPALGAAQSGGTTDESINIENLTLNLPSVENTQDLMDQLMALRSKGVTVG